jgi:hypothetical protein
MGFQRARPLMGSGAKPQYPLRKMSYEFENSESFVQHLDIFPNCICLLELRFSSNKAILERYLVYFAKPNLGYVYRGALFLYEGAGTAWFP